MDKMLLSTRPPATIKLALCFTGTMQDKEEEEDEQTLKPDPRFTNDDGNLKYCSFGP